VIRFYEKYNHIIIEYFENDSYIQISFKQAIEAVLNQKVGEEPFAFLMARFCDSYLVRKA